MKSISILQHCTLRRFAVRCLALAASTALMASTTPAVFSILVGVDGLHAQSAQAKPKPPALNPSTLGANERAVYRVWNAYLESRAGKRAQRADAPSPYWLLSEQKQWPFYDMASSYLNDDAEPVIISIKRADVRSANVYRLITRFYPRGNKPTEDLWRNAMTMTVYAVRDGGDWKLSSALSRNIANWKRDTVGPITYVYAPTYPYNGARARRAVAFTDSLAAAFKVPKLAPLTYFLSNTVDEAYALMGLESDVKYGASGAAAQPINHAIFAGDPKWGEEYRHELVHLIVSPLSANNNTLYFFNEGIATWLGGTIGLSFQESLNGLGDYLREHPTTTIDSLIDSGGPQTQLYRGGALLCAMVFERGGTPAIKSLFDAGTTTEFRNAVSRIMQRPWNDVAIEWRKRALNTARPNS